MRKKILVTGASGTIGTRLCERLIELGYEVIGVDRSENKWNEEVGRRTIKCDLLQNDELTKLPNHVDIIVHLAANSRVMETIIKPEKALENIKMTFNILKFALENNIKKIIFTSSREVYGEAREKPCREDEVVLQNVENPYAASKIACEALIHSFSHCYGLNYITLRLSNVYGMYDDKERVVPLFIKLMNENKPVKIYGGKKTLDFIYIDDAVDSIVLALQKFEKIKNEIFNICSGRATTILELARELKAIMGSKSEIQVLPERPGEVSFFVGSYEKANKLIGFYPKTSLKEGLKKTVNWYLKFYGKVFQK